MSAVLEKSENPRFMQLFQEAMIVFDPYSNRILQINPAFASLLGYTPKQLLSYRCTQLIGSEFAALILFTQAVLDKGSAWTNELALCTSDGNKVDVEIFASSSQLHGQTVIIALIQDRKRLQQLHEHAEANAFVRHGIAEWKRVEKLFQDMEQENQLLLKAVGEGIYGVNAEGKATFVNPAAERILGWTAEELVGKKIHPIMHHTHPDGGHYHAHDCPIYAAFHDGEVHRVENEVFWHKDGTAIPVEYISTPVIDQGQLIGAVVVFRDVSERKQAEAELRAALHEVEQLRQRLEMENAYLQEEIRTGHNYKEIVGTSTAIQRLINQIDLVANTDASVLIYGESGTGKELIARAIHSASTRSQRPLIRVNCAAIPRDLFESEFFGHVKGAFTGAASDRAGRFELANGGTLFLDEVGEIPLELQAKLLRVLQEGQFERLGDSKTRKVDVRIIAATNRELLGMVEEKLFREDLYFRLNVFPIESVPLRQRRDDIPELAMHFLKHSCDKLNKPGIRLSKANIELLTAYNWPGNIRELENVIERAVILARGERLLLELPDTNKDAPSANAKSTECKVDILTREQMYDLEYNNLIQALRSCNGKIFGEDGAATMLGMRPTTLASRIKRFDIDIRQFKLSASGSGRY